MRKPLPRGRRPGQPAFSADLAKAAIRKAKAGSVAHAILQDRIRHSDRSRNAQAIRLGVSQMTLKEAEQLNRWPIGSAGILLRRALGVPETQSVAP